MARVVAHGYPRMQTRRVHPRSSLGMSVRELSHLKDTRLEGPRGLHGLLRPPEARCGAKRLTLNSSPFWRGSTLPAACSITSFSNGKARSRRSLTIVLPLVGMAEIDRRLEQWAVHKASSKYPIEMFFRVRWDEAKLTGEPVNFPTFWGTDDVEPKPIGDRTGRSRTWTGTRRRSSTRPTACKGRRAIRPSCSPASTGTPLGLTRSGPRSSPGQRTGQTISRPGTSGGARSSGRFARLVRKGWWWWGLRPPTKLGTPEPVAAPDTGRR